MGALAIWAGGRGPPAQIHPKSTCPLVSPERSQQPYLVWTENGLSEHRWRVPPFHLRRAGSWGCANIFSLSDGCLFISFRVSFAVQKLLIFIRSHLLIFTTLGGGSESILLRFMSKTVLPMFFAKFYSVQP